MTTVCKECGKDVSDGRNHTCRPKQKTPEEMAAMAEEYTNLYYRLDDGIRSHVRLAYIEAYNAGYHKGYDDGFTQRKEWRKDV